MHGTLKHKAKTKWIGLKLDWWLFKNWIATIRARIKK